MQDSLHFNSKQSMALWSSKSKPRSLSGKLFQLKLGRIEKNCAYGEWHTLQNLDPEIRKGCSKHPKRKVQWHAANGQSSADPVRLSVFKIQTLHLETLNLKPRILIYQFNIENTVSKWRWRSVATKRSLQNTLRDICAPLMQKVFGRLVQVCKCKDLSYGWCLTICYLLNGYPATLRPYGFNVVLDALFRGHLFRCIMKFIVPLVCKGKHCLQRVKLSRRYSRRPLPWAWMWPGT